MPDLGFILCVLACVIIGVTVCGHVTWLGLAAIFNAIFGTHKDQARPQRCPTCGRTSLIHGRCSVCGGVPTVLVSQRTHDDLQAAARQLLRLQRGGHLSLDQCCSLLKVIEVDLAKFGTTLPPDVWPTISKTSPLTAAPPPEIQTGIQFKDQAADAVPLSAPAPIFSSDQPLDAVVIEATAVDSPEVQTPPVAIQTDNPFAALIQPKKEPVAPLPPVQVTPSRTLADMLQGFMEESNIRWGEVIAGLVIVISAIGLVISLRATLERIPYFPALLFLVFTVSFHGAGLYTLRRWKLHAVSRAILIIALLLVPLSFSAGVVMSGPNEAQRPLTDPLLIAAVLIGLSVFGWVAYTGSKELAGEGALRLTTAILGCCFSQVVINRGAFNGLPLNVLTLLALFPVASFLIAAIGQIWRAQAWRRMSSRRIEQTFLILGVSLFALLPPLALLVFKIEPRWQTFKQLAPLLSLVSTCVLTLGLVVHRRALTKSLATFRTAGTSIALLGGALILLMWVVAWPQPELMLNVTLLTGALLLAIAIRTEMPALHAAAVSLLSLAVVIAFFWMQQFVSAQSPTSLQWLQATLLGRTSLLLTLLAAVIGCGGLWHFRERQRRIGLAYVVSAAVLSLLGLTIAGWSGFAPLPAPWTGDGDLAGPLFFCYAIALFAIAITIASEHVLSAAMALLWIALIQLLSANDTARTLLFNLHLLPERPVLMATIIEAVTLAGMALVLSKPSWQLMGDEFKNWQTSDKYRGLVLPLTYGAAVAVIAATPFILWVLPGRFTVHAIYALLATNVWAIVCVARRWPEALAATQAMAAVAIAFAIAAIWTPSTADIYWFARGGHLQAQLLALAGSAAVWSIVRRFARPGTVLHDLLHPKFPPCDHVLLGISVTLLTLLAVSSALPGIAWELGIGQELLTAADIPWLDSAHLSRLVLGLGAVLVALTIALVDRVTGLKLFGLSLAGWAGLFLLAQLWQAEQATASAARWWFVLYGGLLMGLFVARRLLARGLQTQSWLHWQDFDQPTLETFRYQPLLLGVLPMLVLTIIAVAQHAAGVPLHNPLPNSFFDRLGPTASYAGPMLIGVTIFLGLALGQRQPAFALGGGLLFQLAANLAFILHATGKVRPPSLNAAECLQWNTIAAAIYALLWFGLAQWLLPREEKSAPARLKQDQCFLVHVALSTWLVLAVAIWAAGGIICFPDTLSAELHFLEQWSNLIALGLLVAPILAALGVSRATRTWPWGGSAVILMLVMATPLLALRWELLRWQLLRGPGTWAAYHFLELAWLILAVVIASSYAWQQWTQRASEVRPELLPRRGFAPHHGLAAALCGLVIVLAVRGNYDDPAQPFFSAGSTAGVCGALILLGLARRSQPYAIASLVVAPLAAALPWFTPGLTWWAGLNNSALLVSLNGCLLAAILVGGWWQFIEIRTQRRLSQTFSPRWFGPLAGHIAILSVSLILFIASLAYLLYSGSNWYLSGLSAFDWGLVALVMTWVVLGIVNVGSLWDRRAIFIFPMLLVWAWIACALALAPLHQRPLPMICLHALATAGVFALAGHLWSFGANLAAWGERAGISDTVGGLSRIDRWLPTITLVVGLAICGLELQGMWNLPQREHRVAIAFAPALIAYALACLAQLKRQDVFQLTALLLGGLSCVYLGWSDLDPGWTLTDWMTRAFRLLMVLAVTTFGYGLVLPRFVLHAESWLRSSQRAGYVSSALAIITLVGLLALEVSLFQPGLGAGVEPVQVAAVAVLLVLFIVGLISLALAPGASEPAEQQRRTWFVYGAQLVAGLLFAHLYLCQPGWFDGVLKPYWPYVVMAIAFGGVGLGELFWRLRLPVLAEPFQRTGAFLPVLPILGLWIISSKNDYDYTLLLFFAGLMYLILSMIRKSWPAAIAAAVAGNGALWAQLEQSNWGIVQNPQFWLIPPAVSVLVAAQINRHRLKEEMLSAIRYGALIVIYVSSTFEIFLHHADKSLWPPVILALLSLAGALAGVLLRIRAFLYLGAIFTLLAMVSMVWHAARAIEHVWPWWAFGIGMGIAILTLLALFEKNRPQVQALVLRLRQWDK